MKKPAKELLISYLDQLQAAYESDIDNEFDLFMKSQCLGYGYTFSNKPRLFVLFGLDLIVYPDEELAIVKHDSNEYKFTINSYYCDILNIYIDGIEDE